jgi:hypothetical protein
MSVMMFWGRRKSNMSMNKTINSYLGELSLSKKRHLLVEGVSDKQLFEKLIDRLFCFHTESSYRMPHNIQVDLAEIIDIPGVVGNRNKVEKVCVQASNLKNIQFAGFVDREFNGFDLNNFQDLLDKHYVNGCLVWSRGHSIENYLFEYSILRELFWEILNTNWAGEVIQMFNLVFEESLILACSIGLAAYESRKLNFIRDNICLEILQIDNSRLVIDIEKLENYLTDKGMSASDLEKLLERYNYYSVKVRKANLDVVKRLCDGHLGLTFILFACCCCIKEVCPDSTDSVKVNLQTLLGSIRGVEKKRFYQCANWWARAAEEKKCEYPEELFQILGVID